MKKSLLTVLILGAGILAQAQNVHEGYHPTGDNNQPKPYAADFVTIPISFDNVYWWNQLKLSDPGKGEDSTVLVKSDSLKSSISKTCIHRTLPFVYKATRDDVNKVLKYTMDLPYGVYAPIGVGFGDGNTLDLSQGNALVAFTFKNTSTTTLDLTVGLQDANKKIINSIPKTRTVAPGLIYTEEVKFKSIAPGETRNIKVNFNKSEYPAWPYYANYPKDTCDRGLTPSKDSTFQYNITSAVSFTIVNHATLSPDPLAAADNYKPLLFKGTFEISKFRVGTYDSMVVTGLNDEDYILADKFTVYPNPVVVGGTINLSSEATNIKVMDVLGNVVLSAASAKQINVAVLNKGVYTIQSSKGKSRFVIE